MKFSAAVVLGHVLLLTVGAATVSDVNTTCASYDLLVRDCSKAGATCFKAGIGLGDAAKCESSSLDNAGAGRCREALMMYAADMFTLLSGQSSVVLNVAVMTSSVATEEDVPAQLAQGDYSHLPIATPLRMFVSSGSFLAGNCRNVSESTGCSQQEFQCVFAIDNDLKALRDQAAAESAIDPELRVPVNFANFLVEATPEKELVSFAYAIKASAIRPVGGTCTSFDSFANTGIESELFHHYSFSANAVYISGTDPIGSVNALPATTILSMGSADTMNFIKEFSVIEVSVQAYAADPLGLLVVGENAKFNISIVPAVEFTAIPPVVASGTNNCVSDFTRQFSVNKGNLAGSPDSLRLVVTPANVAAFGTTVRTVRAKVHIRGLVDAPFEKLCDVAYSDLEVWEPTLPAPIKQLITYKSGENIPVRDLASEIASSFTEAWKTVNFSNKACKADTAFDIDVLVVGETALTTGLTLTLKTTGGEVVDCATGNQAQGKCVGIFKCVVDDPLTAALTLEVNAANDNDRHTIANYKVRTVCHVPDTVKSSAPSLLHPRTLLLTMALALASAAY